MRQKIVITEHERRLIKKQHQLSKQLIYENPVNYTIGNIKEVLNKNFGGTFSVPYNNKFAYITANAIVAALDKVKTGQYKPSGTATEPSGTVTSPNSDTPVKVTVTGPNDSQGVNMVVNIPSEEKEKIVQNDQPEQGQVVNTDSPLNKPENINYKD